MQVETVIKVLYPKTLKLELCRALVPLSLGSLCLLELV